MSYGLVFSTSKTVGIYVWPVRTGSGGPSGISVSPTSHDYGNVTVGDTSKAQSFTVSNNGDADFVGIISITGTDAAEFSIQNDLCSGQTVAPSGSCTVEAVFSPTVEVVASANLSIQSNDSDTSTLDVPLSGTGTCAYSISPASNSVNSSGGTDSVDVITEDGCSWTATSNDDWITIDSGYSGSGDGTVDYTIAVNTGTSLRTGTMTIAGETFTVSQTDISMDDEIAPTVIIDTPSCNTYQVQVYMISGTASDDDSGVEKVELQITDGTWYVDGSQAFTTTPTWIEVTGTNSWSFSSSFVNWTGGFEYTISVRATDYAGNQSSEETCNFTFSSGTIEQAYTTLSLELTSQTILQNETIDASA